MDTQKELQHQQHTENDYDAHQRNPDPSPESVFEENDEGAGSALKWILPPIILALLITWMLFYIN